MRRQYKNIQNEERWEKDDMKWKRTQRKKRTDNTKREDRMRETIKSTCDERLKESEKTL